MGRHRLTVATTDQGLARVFPWLDAAAAALRLPGSMLYGMHVALEEAVMNVAMHAYPPGAPGEVGMELLVADVAATLVIEDEGVAFDPTMQPIKAQTGDPREIEPGGLGTTLMRHYCHDIRHERVDGRNRLTLRFLRPATA